MHYEEHQKIIGMRPCIGKNWNNQLRVVLPSVCVYLCRYLYFYIYIYLHQIQFNN